MKTIRISLLAACVLTSVCFAKQNNNEQETKQEDKQAQTPKLSTTQLLKLVQQVDAWVGQEAAKLSEEDALLVLNAMYIMNQVEVFDVLVRSKAQTLSAFSLIMRNNTNNDELATGIREFLTQFQESRSAQTNYIHLWNACHKHIESLKSPAVENALDSFHTISQAAICSHADEQAAEIDNQIKQAHEALAQNATELSYIAGIFKGVAEGNLPIEHEPSEKNFLKLPLAYNLAQSVEESAFQIVQVSDFVCKHLGSQRDIALAIQAVFYAKLHALLSQRKVTPMLMFSPDGLLAQEARTVKLPAKVR